MPDREKVIKGLECCVAYDYKCNDCPYQDDGGAEDSCYSDELKADAIALLKAQEPVKPIIDIRHGKSMWRCGSCATALQPNQIYTKFCFNCGKAVKWE